MNEPIHEIISPDPQAPVVVLFGGNPLRRDEVLRLIGQTVNVTAYGTLSEDEGMRLLNSLPRVDLVLIGGRYSPQQRQRIANYLQQHWPHTRLTQPGWDYPYDNREIQKDILKKLGMEKNIKRKSS